MRRKHIVKLDSILKLIKKEFILVVLMVILLITSISLKRIPRYTLNDFKTVFTIMVFLIIVKGLERSGFLRYLSWKVEGGRFIPLKLVTFTFFLSMFVTNDVAILTVVPLTLKLKVKNRERLIILETLASNGGSALTPFGNPQNIFIYYFYHLDFHEFILAIYPFVLLSLGFILLCLTRCRECEAKEREKSFHERMDRVSAIIYSLFFMLFILSVLRLAPMYLGFIPIAYALIFDRESLKIDYPLLFLFILFFGLTDNLIHILKLNLHESAHRVFIFSSLLSQVISNVPSALFFADFTKNWKDLLWGVSVGGFGSMLSSLANLLSYRLVKGEIEKPRVYALNFQIHSFTMFFIGMIFYFIFN